jgi:hypothetical protein
MYKLCLLFLAILLGSIEGSSRDVKLRDGTIYSSATVLFKNCLGIGIDQDGKTLFIDFADIDPSLLASFDFDLEAYKAAKLNGIAGCGPDTTQKNPNDSNENHVERFKKHYVLTLRNGKQYKSTKVKRVERLGITIQHADGLAFVDYSLIAPDLLTEFKFSKADYDSAKIEREKVSQELKERQLALISKTQKPKGIAERDIASNDQIINRDYSTPRYSAPVNTSGSVHVNGYYRKDGTYVRPHTRSR